jgi:hypothetical protein
MAVSLTSFFASNDEGFLDPLLCFFEVTELREIASEVVWDEMFLRKAACDEKEGIFRLGRAI